MSLVYKDRSVIQYQYRKVMKRPYRTIPLFLLILIATCFPLVPACSSPPQGKAEDGIRWFRLNRCNGCHGEGGNGGRGPVLASTDLSFRKFINKLRAPNSAIMPTFDRETLSDQDAADIYAWLRDQER